MKVSSSLLKAMLVTATVSAAVGCQTVHPLNGVGKAVIKAAKSVIERPAAPESCPMCGMG